MHNQSQAATTTAEAATAFSLLETKQHAYTRNITGGLPDPDEPHVLESYIHKEGAVTPPDTKTRTEVQLCELFWAKHTSSKGVNLSISMHVIP